MFCSTLINPVFHLLSRACVRHDAITFSYLSNLVLFSSLFVSEIFASDTQTDGQTDGETTQTVTIAGPQNNNYSYKTTEN